MRLTQLQISGFRSIADDLVVHLRPTLTCLIGANENGKSNILEAIRILELAKFDDHDRYSHSSDSSHPKLRFVFELSPREKSGLIGAIEEGISEIEQQIAALGSDPGKKPLVDQKTLSLKWRRSALDHYRDQATPIFAIDILANGERNIDLQKVKFTGLNHPVNFKKFLGTSLPKARLFTPSSELADVITAPELDARKNLAFEGLLKLGRAWDDRALLFRGDIVAERKLVETGKALTKRLRRLWSQGARHTFRLAESGGRLRVSIEDATTLDMPSRRSLGFRSFLAFALSLYAETETFEPEGFLLLFDEPGIHLHPRGQKDLLRELRRLSVRNQIVYTTHSPFLIDRNELDATLLVQKEVRGPVRGTRVISKPYGANWAPLTEALGITPADGFFPGERTLLVEGTSDRAYVLKYMQLCRNHTRADLNYLNILDGDRRGEMEAIARILITSGRDLVVLTDGDGGGRDWRKWLKGIAGHRRDQLKAIDLGEIVGTSKPTSIEDALDFNCLITAVEAWKTQVIRADAAIDVDEIRRLAQGDSLGNAIAAHMVSRGVIKWPSQFSKTNVADFYCRGDVPKPPKDSPMTELCLRITKELGIGPS